MNIDELTLGQIKQLQGLLGQTPVSTCCEDWGWHIVILQRGWVMVGKLQKKGEYFKLLNGDIIRKWGTTYGLGQLAKHGKQSGTILEPTPETSFHELTMIGAIKCDPKKWE
jgi:hypothetical protein